MTLKGVFKPMVVFFKLTNSPVTFQMMINEILWDLINIRKVVSFIDDVIVGIETEKGHDEIVKEVAKRLVENNLYIKPEKYKWKVREVGFLEVVIRPREIEMKKEKAKEVLDWLTLKGVKNVQKFLGLADYYRWFIKDFTVIARPLHDIVRKNQK